MKYVAGLDGGGTKTAVTVLDENGGTVSTFGSGALNFNGADEAAVLRTFRDIFNGIAEACGGLDNCAQVAVGAAGVSNPAVTARIENAVRHCGHRGGLVIMGDQEAAHYGAHEGGPGIILIAGTGTICYGRNEAGHTHRTGGFGHLIDDEGSGYSIGRELLTALVKAFDGRAPATPISAMVHERLGTKTVGDVIAFVYDRSRSKKDVAALAPILSEACGLGDEAALAIADRSAAALVELVVPVAAKLSLQRGELAPIGSVLLKNVYVRSAFEEKLGRVLPELRVISAKRDASFGAALMALRRQDAREGENSPC
ncbi:ATPase [Cohnella pontilimi]|uniref:ATPase n=1 Tax=Cohnella pontilimi TaxID=2564100 RepID=A0A4U0FBY0_9BACL|nr:BadF/BadG/BcrA/BcrD ATPase family protein [Cohnella pontilimi]TJY42295.1 ATPase [Cohnella pontilimi]